MSGISRRYRLALGVGVLALIVGLAIPALAQENIQGSAVTAVNPITLTAGSTVTLCFTVNFISPDFEYMDHFDVDLPDGWTVGTVAANSVPAANGCSGALPPVVGNGAGNVVFWQSTGYPPTTGCGAWVGGSAGANFDFCVDVTVPSCTGAPWSLPWNIIGDGYGGVPHTVAGTFASVECTGGGGPAVTLAKTVGTVPGVCAATNAVTVSTGTDVYYCFQATNTGTVTFELHDLVDDHLGTILNNFPYTLAPGASSPEVIVPDTATATVTNTATWTAADSAGGLRDRRHDHVQLRGHLRHRDGGRPDRRLARRPSRSASALTSTERSYTDFWVSSNGFLATTGDQQRLLLGSEPAERGGSERRHRRLVGGHEPVGRRHAPLPGVGERPEPAADLPGHQRAALLERQPGDAAVQAVREHATSSRCTTRRRRRTAGATPPGSRIRMARLLRCTTTAPRPSPPRWRSATRRRCRRRRRRLRRRR